MKTVTQPTRAWFDNAIRYMRGDPALTNCDFSEGAFANFLKFWDAQTPHFRAMLSSLFHAAPDFVVGNPTVPAPQETPTQHSPLPWVITDRRKAPLPNIVIKSGEEIVAMVEGIHMRDRMLRWKPEDADMADAHATANAELIVKCVNRDPAFQKLLEVAETLDRLDWVIGYEMKASEMQIVDEALDLAREALRLARESG